MTINYIRTTTRGANVCLQRTVLCGCNFAYGYYVNIPRISSFYVTFCGQTKRALRVRVCSSPTTVTSGHRERGYQIRFSVRFWAGIFGDIFMGRCLLPDGMTAHRYRDFLETALPRLFEDVPLAVRQMWFQHDGAAAHYGEDIRQ
jgi:hypothetical protein